MKLRPQYRLPQEKEDKLKRAVRLEWITIFFLLTITVVMYLAKGSSQAMKTAWIEDILSLIPPIVFLIAMRFRDRPPTQDFPYGYRRTAVLAFLSAAVAILVLGLYVLYDAVRALVTQHHPTIGHYSIFGTTWEIWGGWVMIAALIYSMIPPVILGRMKLSLAEEIHEKTLHADASMNKADWMTAGAAILGVLGVGIGWWWADAVAAGIISLDIVKDGVTNVKRAMADLMDRRPTAVSGGDLLSLPDDIVAELRSLPDVLDADVRLREEGHVISGELFVVLAGQDDVARRLAEIAQHAAGLDWRLYNLVVMPVESISE